MHIDWLQKCTEWNTLKIRLKGMLVVKEQTYVKMFHNSHQIYVLVRNKDSNGKVVWH